MELMDDRCHSHSMFDEHTKILNQEKLKTKKKRVSFSIFTANTLEQIRDLRLEREKDLMNFVERRSKLNDSYEIVSDEVISI